MKILTTILACCILMPFFSGCNSGTGTKSETGNDIVLKLDPGPDNPRNSEGDFVTLKDGRILFIYSHFTGSSGDDFGNALLTSRYSDDKGKTWSGESEKIVAQEGDMNVMSVSLLRLQNGEIAMFYALKNSVTDCIPYMRISTDEGKTWSDATRCIADRTDYFVLNNNRIIQLKNGRLLMPVSIHFSPGGEWGPSSNMGHIYCYYSDDNGRKWISGNEVANPDSIIVQEPGVIELKNGNVFMFVRTTSGVQYISFSYDKGNTWSAFEPGNIKSPCSPASIARIPSSGDLLMVWNNNGINQKRTPLTVAISKDEGKTWENLKNIEDDPGGTFCYTAIHFTDKNVLLGYSNWANMGSTIRMINQKWIYQ